MEIQYAKSAAKAIQSLPAPLRRNIGNRIKKLTETPPIGDIKVMQGYSDGRCRLRVGSIRIVYKYLEQGNGKVLYIIDVGYRGDIYK